MKQRVSDDELMGGYVREAESDPWQRWSSEDINRLALDLRDARAEIARLRAEYAELLDAAEAMRNVNRAEAYIDNGPDWHVRVRETRGRFEGAVNRLRPDIAGQVKAHP